MIGGAEHVEFQTQLFNAITNDMFVPDVYIATASERVDATESVVKEESLEQCERINPMPPASSVIMECKNDLVEAGTVDVVNDVLFMEDLEDDPNVDVANVGFDFVPHNPDVPAVNVVESDVPLSVVPESSNVCDERTIENSMTDDKKVVSIRGMRAVPEPELFAAGQGSETLRSAHNDKWSLKRVDQLRSQLGWDMSVPFTELPFKQMDELLANMFSRVTKVNGKQYPGASLKNMMNGFNRVIRRAYQLRLLNGIAGEEADKDFNIKRHRAFTKTHLVLNAAIKKGGREGVNKKVKKAPEITQAMEDAIFLDVEHQVLNNYGCQKRLAAYLMLRIGVRGGKELWLLKRPMIKIKTNSRGEEYVQFEERHSKTQEYTIDRCEEHQFRKPYYSTEPDFVFTVKQYYRHLAPLTDPDVVQDLFTTPNLNPLGIIWYNRKSKVSEDRSGQWLGNMLRLVGLPEKLFSNKSGRVSLITRMAAQGVPDDVGMIISGHRTLSGYSRYDRTLDLKQEAATLCGERRDLDYTMALKQVTEQRKLEHVQSSIDLKPLVAPEQMKEWQEKLRKGKQAATEGSISSKELQVELMPEAQVSCTSSVTREMSVDQGTKLQTSDVVRVHDLPQKLTQWHRDYDGINWELALQNDPGLANALAGGSKRKMTISTVAGNSFSNMQHCTIHINVCQPAKIHETDKENIAPGHVSKQVENVAAADVAKQLHD